MTGLRVLALLIVSLAAAGCAAITEPLGMEDPFAIERPFHGVAQNDTMLAQAVVVPALVIDTPAGLSAEVAAELRNRVVLAARKRDLPASTEPMALAWMLSAQAATVTSPGEAAPADTQAKPAKNAKTKKKAEPAPPRAPIETTVLSWRLIDAEGNERTQFVVSFPGTEATLSDSIIQLVADQTTAALDQALARPRTQAVEVAAAAVVKPKAWIGTIKGAPGDGNKALARALQGVLPLKGVLVEAMMNKAQWRIEGEVKVEPSPTQDKVTLTWRVLDAKGKEAGSIRQQNAVPHDRLNKPWAEIAGFAAEAAAEGIAQLIQQVTKAKPA